MIPQSRLARHQKIRDILAAEEIHNQVQLAEALGEFGIEVTQTTLSRDLDEIGARKVKPAGGGKARYVADPETEPDPGGGAELERLRKRIRELAVGLDYSWCFAMLRTAPGGAQYLASFVDRADLPEVVGCTAGDDTIFLLAREPATGKDVYEILRGLRGED